MKATPLTLDPEIRGLIEEIAATPGSTLLHTPPSDVYHSPYDRLRPTTPGLTTAERHLVEVHGEELAWWLRMGCVVGLLSSPLVEAVYGYRDSATEPATTPTQARLREMINRQRRTRDARLDPILSDRFIEEVGSFDAVPRAARLSSLLRPSPEAEIYFAVHCMETGQTGSAIRVLRQAMHSYPAPELLGMCWSNIGRLRFQQGKFRLAAAAYGASASHGPARPTPLICWFVSALACDDPGQVARASEMLDRLVAAEHPRVGQFIGAHKGALSPAMKLAGQRSSGNGPTSARLIDEL